jgi:hypothetical protein
LIDHGDRGMRHEQGIVHAVAFAYRADGCGRDGDDVEFVTGKQVANPLHEPVGVLALEDLEPRQRPGRRDRFESARLGIHLAAAGAIFPDMIIVK